MDQTVLVFQDNVIADAILLEIAATPFGLVWVWYDPDVPAQVENIVQYNQSADGRCAIAHPFSEEDRAWLEIYLEGMAGVQILDSLPADWQYPQVYQ